MTIDSNSWLFIISQIMTDAVLPVTSTNEVDFHQWLDIDNLYPPHDSAAEDENAQSLLIREPEYCPSLATSVASECHQKRRETTTSATRSTPRNPGLCAQSHQFSIITFPSDPKKPKGRKKKRSDFDEQRRLEVAQTRRSGACLRCRIRRIAVSTYFGGRTSSSAGLQTSMPLV